MNTIGRYLKYIFKAVLLTLLLLIIVSAVILMLEIKVNLNHLNKPVELAVEQVLDRDLAMQGDVVLVPTLWPTLEITAVSISNPKGHQWLSGDKFAHFGRLRLQLGLVPLLTGEIYVADITAENVRLNLETDKQGNSSWDFGLAEQTEASRQPSQENSAKQADNASGHKGLFHFESLDNISFNDLNVYLIDQSINSNVHFKLEQLNGHITSRKGIEIEFKGQLQDRAYSGQLQGAGLNELRRKGHKWPLTINMDIAGTPVDFSGTLIRGTTPELSASLEVGQTDVGATLAWFNIIDGLQISSKHLSIQTRIKGKNLAEMIASAQLEVLLKDTAWILKDKNTAATLPVRIAQGTIKLEPEQPVQVVLDGKLDQSAVNISIQGAKAIEYTRKNVRTPLSINVRTLGARLHLDTMLSRQINARNLGFNMRFEGNKLSDLNPLLNTDLPPLGPYRLKGFFGVNDKGYRIKNLLLTVNDSQLNGNFLLDTKKQPLFLSLKLNSKQIQLNDFDTGDWSAVEKQSDDKTREELTVANNEQKKKQKQQKREKALKLLSYENLKRYDVAINIAVEKVLSGKDNLGSGRLSVVLKKARLSLNLEELKLPGGSAKALFEYQPSGQKSIDVALKTRIERFNYGILERRIDPQSKVGGLISLDVDLASAKARNIDSLLTNSKGHLDFAWMPEALNAELFELWAVNLITAVLKSMDDEKVSKVNCVIGRFEFDQGMMRQKVVYADTTRMRMYGEAEADFKKRIIKVRVTPQAKKAEFFSLATPVSVEGSFEKFGLSINPLGLTKTVVSFVTSPIHVPVRRLFEEKLPEDGKEACKAMWEAADVE